MSFLETLKDRRLRLNIAIEPDSADAAQSVAVTAIEAAGAAKWKVVEARIDSSGVTIHAAYTIHGEGPDSTAPRRNLGDCDVLFVPNPQQSVCRLLDMPDVPQAQLEQIVALRLEVELPYPPKEATWACRRLPRNGDEIAPVLLIAQANKSLESGAALSSSWKIGGAGVTFAAAALLELARSAEDVDGTIAAAKIDRDRALVAVSRNGALCYARQLRLPEERAGSNGASEQWLHGLTHELKQCLFDYSLRTNSPAPLVLRLAGEGIHDEHDCATLETGLEMPVSLVDAPDILFVGDADALEGDLAADYALGTGALLGYYRERTGLPVAAPALRPARKGGGLRLKRSMAKLLAINVVLVAVLAASFFLVRNARLASADRFVRESKALVHDMETLKEEVDILSYEEGQQVSMLEILMALSEVLPPELKVESMNLDAKGVLIITGRAQTVEAVSDGVTQALEKSPVFKNPEFKGATQGNEGYGFTLTCELMSAVGAGR